MNSRWATWRPSRDIWKGAAEGNSQIVVKPENVGWGERFAALTVMVELCGRGACLVGRWRESIVNNTHRVPGRGRRGFWGPAAAAATRTSREELAVDSGLDGPLEGRFSPSTSRGALWANGF